MAELERIVAKIEADMSGLRQDLNRLEREFQGFSKKTERSVNSVTAGFKRLGAAVGSYFTLQAVTQLGRAALQTVSQFEDLQDSLNVVFGGLREGEAAMNQILNTANKTPLSIQDLTQAFITLQASGIQPTSDLMMTFADTASVTTNRLETFNALVRVMSRSVGGGLGLEELNQIADRGIPVWRILEEELGKNRLQLSEVGKTAAGAKRIMDALINGLNKRFGGATENALDNISVALSNFEDAAAALVVTISDLTGAGGFFTDMVNDIAGAMVRWRFELKYIDEHGIDGLIKFREELGLGAFALFESEEALERYDAALLKAIAGTETAGQKNQNTAATVDELTEQINKVRKELEFETEQLKRSAEDQMLYDLAKKEGVADTEAFVEAMRPYVQQLLRAEEAHTDLEEAIKLEDEATEELKKHKDKLLDQLQNLAEANLTAAESYQATLDKLDLLRYQLEQIGVSGPEVEKILERAAKAAKKEFDDANESLQDTKDVLQDVGATFESSFERAILEGEKLRDVLQGLAEDLLQIAIRKMILGPLADAVFGDDGFLGGLFGSAKGNAFSGSVRPFARGGVVSGPSVFPMATGTGLMGEAGPEAILPLQRTSSGHLGVRAAGGGGKGTVVNVYAPAGSSVREERQETMDLEAINLYIENTVSDGINRAGSKIHRALRHTFGASPQVVPR